MLDRSLTLGGADASPQRAGGAVWFSRGADIRRNAPHLGRICCDTSCQSDL